MLIIHDIREVSTDLDFMDHCYAIGLFAPHHPVPVTIETAKYYPVHWHWIIWALARMRDKVRRAMQDGRHTEKG